MLILMRHVDQMIRVGSDVRIMVTKIVEDKVWLGIDAPSETSIHREELYLEMEGRGDVRSLADRKAKP